MSKINCAHRTILFLMCTFITVHSPRALCTEGEVADEGCSPPAESHWNWDIQKLTENTPDIIVAKLVSSKDTKKPPTVKPDFTSKGGYAFDFRDKHGKRLSLNDDVWDSAEWTFEVTESLKGKYKKGDVYSFITLKSETVEQDKLTSVLCHFPMRFNINRQYIIFVNSFNKLGYSEYSSTKSKTYQAVKNLIKKNVRRE